MAPKCTCVQWPQSARVHALTPNCACVHAVTSSCVSVCSGPRLCVCVCVCVCVCNDLKLCTFACTDPKLHVCVRNDPNPRTAHPQPHSHTHFPHIPTPPRIPTWGSGGWCPPTPLPNLEDPPSPPRAAPRAPRAAFGSSAPSLQHSTPQPSVSALGCGTAPSLRSVLPGDGGGDIGLGGGDGGSAPSLHPHGAAVPRSTAASTG